MSNFDRGDTKWINDEEVEERTTALKDGPFDGQLTPRPNARMRKQQHAKAFRLPDEEQPDLPQEMGGSGRVLFAFYMWLTSDQAYCYVDSVMVGSEEELNQAIRVLEAT